jgi:hypothetical protein
MPEEHAAQASGLGLADAIALLRDELLRARAAGGRSDIQLPVNSMTVELTVTATRSLDGGWRRGARARVRAQGDGGLRRAGGPGG